MDSIDKWGNVGFNKSLIGDRVSIYQEDTVLLV